MSASTSNIIPLLRGDYPDPSIVRVGADYYMTHSANQYWPGLLIWHSQDLVNWQPLTTALSAYDGDIWAPDIVYHEGLFLIYYTTSGGNHVVFAQSIEGPWSQPLDLKVGHIDPGHIVTAEGKRYLFLSGGHMIELTPDGLAVQGEPLKVYDVWAIPSHWRIEGIALEGPKLIYRNGWHYMVSAAGGTAGPSTSHMAIVARAREVIGPWEESPHNPLIRTRLRTESWWSRGHGTLIDGVDGQWWLVYHAYENGYYTLGRSTLMEPILWTEDGWPVVDASPSRCDFLPSLTVLPSLSDNFQESQLGWQWRFHGFCSPERARCQDGALHLQAQTAALAEGNSPLTLIPRDHAYEVKVDVELDGEALEGGLVLYYSAARFVAFGISEKGVFLRRGARAEYFLSRSGLRGARLKLVNDHQEVDFFVRLPGEGEEWVQITSGQDVSGWHHNSFGGFVSLRVGLYAAGEGNAIFRAFEYQTLP